MDKARIEQLTDAVMAAITDDVRSGVVPWTVTNFGQLHDWVDANMYLEHAGQQFDAGDPDSIAEVNAIEDEVSRRLRNGAVTGGGWRQVTWTVQQSHSMVLPLAMLREEHRDEPLTAGEVNDEAIAEFEGEATLVSQSGRKVNRAVVVDAPAYVEPAERYSGASILDDPRLKLRTALAELRRLDAEVKRSGDQDHHDGCENAQDEVAEQANGQARAALHLALTLLGMTQTPGGRLLSADEAVDLLVTGDHRDSRRGSLILDAALIAALRAGQIVACLLADGQIAFTRVTPDTTDSARTDTD